MTRASPHRLILASAGTGKTYQLTGRYLELLFAGVAPERILATTFTRKAAGEILDRVLRRLAEAAEDETQRRQLCETLGREVGAAEVRAQLVALVRVLDRFRIRTLDAFFVHLGRLFALDLGLPPDWSIVEDAADKALQREALGRALEHADPRELLEILRGLRQGEDTSWVERVLLPRVALGRDAWLDSDERAWHTLVVPPGLPAERLAELPARIEALPLARNKGGQPNANWLKAKTRLAERVLRRDWLGALTDGIIGKLLAGVDSFSSHPIDAAWHAVAEDLMAQARHWLLAGIDTENRAAYRWLARFEHAYEALKREERAYRFEDLPKALHPRGEQHVVAQDLIWYRLDGRIDHLLLDEFQDTSPVQWRLLGNLADEILADGTGARSFFCVGDVKQSIYGWRNAEPRLLERMHERYPVLVPERMSRSHRSSQIVLDTVARVFGTIAGNPALSDRPARQRAAQAFQQSFDPPQAKRELPGAAWLVMAQRPANPTVVAEEDEPHDVEAEEEEGFPVLRLAAERTRDILDQAPLATVGILLRRNEWVPPLIRLLRDQGIRASGEGGNPLVDSPAVLQLVSLLHLADHPTDTAAAFHVATSPLGPVFGMTTSGFRERAAVIAALVRGRLAAEGYGRFCASLAPALACGHGSWDRKRYDQLVDLAYAFEDQADQRADRFVDHVRDTRVEDPSATQVQVMTVHAAKGLEFDAVLLPELDVPLEPHRTTLLTRRSDPSGSFDAISHTRGSQLARLDPDGLGVLTEDHEERTTREALCLLYVALTRARYRVDMLVQHRRDPTRASKTFAGILRSALGVLGPAADGVLWGHPENASPWFPASLLASPAAAASAPRGALRWRDADDPAPVRRTPSAQEGAGRLDPRDLLRSPSSEARVRGLLVHRWLQEVEWLEDFAASDEELVAIGQRISSDAALVARTLRELRTALGGRQTRALLERGERGGRTVRAVWRERPFSVLLPAADGGEELWSGAFDRIVLEERAGELVAAELIDFKTDRVEPDDLAERTAYYRPQLDSYRRVLAHMMRLSPEAIRAKLAFVHADAVAEL